MEESGYKSVLCVRPDSHVYCILPWATNHGYRAAEWQLDQPSWSGWLRITAKEQIAYIKLEDRTSGKLFAQAPVDQFPGTAVESVMDSSRYFVIPITDGNCTGGLSLLPPPAEGKTSTIISPHGEQLPVGGIPCPASSCSHFRRCFCTLATAKACHCCHH
uniref:NECAP PHear domain-containing protein n=1 Tax=Callithrix jacchus TaxID=9483 RepID=A0A5F4VYB4_CALJA